MSNTSKAQLGTRQPSVLPGAPATLLQRACACGGTPGVDGECAACRAKRLQRKDTSRTAPTVAPPLVHEVLGSAGQPLDPGARAFMEPRFGHDFSRVRIHTDARAAESARAVGARAYTVGPDVVFGPGQYAPATGAGRQLLAHELAHVVQQSAQTPASPVPIAPPSGHNEIQSRQASERIAGGATAPALTLAAPALMRDLAQEPPPTVPPQTDLTATQVQAAIRYNRASYNADSTRLIQDLVGGPQTGTFDEQTVRLVALIQRQFGLVPADGKVGPNTYDFLIRELQAEGVNPGTCLTLFQVVGPQRLTFFRTSPTAGVIQSRFDIHARFDPRCNCGDFEYRQFISGHVELLEALPPGVTPPASSGCATLISATAGTLAWNMDGCFQIPGGGLSARMREDGDAAVPAGTAGRRYGHRSARPNPADGRDEYRPNRATGCEYQAFDVPELAPVPATPADSGDVYDWTMRFRGVIQRSDGSIVAERWWSIIDTVVIP